MAILKTTSNKINKLQKFFDPFLLVNIFFLVFNDGEIKFTLIYFLIFFSNLLILNSRKIYNSYRINKLSRIIPDLLFISALVTIISSLIGRFESSAIYYDLIRVFAFTFLYLFLHHFFLRLFLRFIRSKGLNFRNVIFFGNKKSYEKIKMQLKKYPWLGYRINYWFSPNKIDYEKKEFKTEDIYCAGGILDLMKTVKNEDLDKLFFCIEDSDELSFEQVLNFLGDSCIPVTYIPTWDPNPLSLRKEYFGDIAALNLWNPVYSPINEKIKRIFDLVLSITFLVLFSPFFILISILIKCSSRGPILFIQPRYGIKGNLFYMYKFRTMYYEKNQSFKNIIQAKIEDKRITRVGKFLRKYSLDELPQLINVIKGEMSLVGPRPHAIQHNEYYRKLITGYMQRHSKLPGMTGLAQINGARGETSNIENMKLRINYDLEYNNNWSLIKDFEILLNSIFEVIQGNGY